jgi:putative ABC transport system permease protein
MASYSLATLWYERQRYLPGVLAVAFSALLIAMQCGLLLGLFSITSIPIDHTRADVWMGTPRVLSVDLGEAISEGHLARMGVQPEVERCEPYLQGFAYWSKPGGGRELCMVIGSYLSPDSLGKVRELTPEQCGRLGEEGAVIVDESDLERLGIKGVGSRAEISGQQVHVVGLTKGLKSLAGPYVFCSISTARPRLGPALRGETTTYVLGRCRHKEDAAGVVARLRKYGDVSAFTAREFSRRTQLHWMTKTKAGAALGYAAALGLLVGAVVTSQTLYAATVASLREYAVLRALGIPRWRMAFMVVSQSFWIGIIGIVLALPAVYGLSWVADHLMSVEITLPWWLQMGSAAVTLVMALLSGLFALRSLRLIEPAMLLR